MDLGYVNRPHSVPLVRIMVARQVLLVYTSSMTVKERVKEGVRVTARDRRGRLPSKTITSMGEITPLGAVGLWTWAVQQVEHGNRKALDAIAAAESE